MPKTMWWLRLVGGFYLLLTAGNLLGMAFYPQMFNDTLPYPADDLAVQAFSDAWLVFILELAALGIMLLYAARDPARSGILVLTVVLAEMLRGVVADAIWIMRGYSVVSYSVFIVIHLVIIVTGLWFLRQESPQAAG